MSTIRILFVDDNAMLAEALGRAFTRDPRFEWAGWLCSAENLSRTIVESKPTVVLMDVDIPGVDTFGVVRLLTRDHPECKVVMFSGHIRQEFTDAAIDMGAHGYLHKGDEIADLRENLVRVAEGALVLSPMVRDTLWTN